MLRACSLCVCVHFSRSLVLYWQNVSIDYICQLPQRPRRSAFLSHTCIHVCVCVCVCIYSLRCLLAFFFLTYSSPSFHLIVHPHNFLIRFAGRTRENIVQHASCCFFCMRTHKRTPSLLHYSGTSFLFPSFASSSSSPSPSLLSFSSSPFHIHTATQTSHKWSADESWLVDNCRRRSTLSVYVYPFVFFHWSCVLETHWAIPMSSLLHFYRTRSATTINQLKPLQRIRSHSPDDVLLRQKVIDVQRLAEQTDRYASLALFAFLLFLSPVHFPVIQSNLFVKPLKITTSD